MSPSPAPDSTQNACPKTAPGAWALFAAWGPCGYAPIAPGTVGTLGAIPLFWALSRLSLPLYLVTISAFIALAGYAAHRAGLYWKTADASPIVIDEVAGYLVTMALTAWSWQAVLAGFFLFRLFDILKPWPASRFDRVKNGFGVVMDDVAAGLFAAASLWLLSFGARLAFGCGEGLPWYCAPFRP